jgi:hypothetical protein
VHLYVVSMSSSLARRSCISFSMAGSVIYLPLLLGISLSSGGSGVCLSLLLGGMVNFLLLCYRKQRTFMCYDTRNDDARPLHNPQVGRSMSTQDLSSTTGLNKSVMLFYFPFGKPSPTINSRNSPFFFGKSDFALSRIHWSCACLSNLQNPKIDKTDPSSSLSNLSLSQFQQSRCRATRLLNSRIPICRNLQYTCDI